MSLIDERVHDILETITLIESNSLVYFQKYVQGVNLTYFDCDDTIEGCLPKVPPNVVRILGHIRHIEYVNIPDEDSCYYSSLVIPIFQQLARRVNLSIELYVSKYSSNAQQLTAIENNVATTIDRVPILYNYDHDRNGQKCVPPLYMLNQLQIMTVRAEIEHSVEEIFKTFSINIWLIILLYYVLCVITDIVTMHRSKMFCLVDTIINYFKVFLAKEADNTNYNKLLFMFWFLGCIPLVEIFRNDMIAKIVDSNYLLIDNVQDLLDTKMEIYAMPGDITLIKGLTKSSQYESTRENFKKLLNRTQELLLSDSKWIEIFTDPKKINKMLSKVALLEDESAVKMFYRILSQMYPIHASSESYIPQYITPICYNKNFAFSDELVGLTRQLFEYGLLSHWEQLKVRFLEKMAKRGFRMLAGDDIIDRIFLEKENTKENQLMANLLQYITKLCIILTLIDLAVFAIELIYYSAFGRKKTNRVESVE